MSAPCTIVVFGGSEISPDDDLYGDTRRSAELLAHHGCRIATGGYGGIMEAASRGAHDAGGEAVGVTSPAFQGAEPNRWLDEVLAEEDLFTRTRRLIHLADAFLVYPGRSGTLSELSFVWALVRARQAPPRPVALVGERWGRLLDRFVEEEVLEDRLREVCRVHPDGPLAARWLLERLGRISEQHGGEAPTRDTDDAIS